MAGKERPLAERFWPKVQKGDGCWEWQAVVSNKGYGMIAGPGGRFARKLTAHRVSWMLHYGDVPDGMCVLHRCDNRRCVRPDHLFLGTLQDNTKDMHAKGRQGPGGPPGERAATAKLTADQVRAIRSACDGGVSRSSLAKEYGVSWQSVAAIVDRRNWRHVA